MAKLFVSYSRKDSVVARKLIETFKSIQQEVWVDWESIPPAVDWLQQIFRGIKTACTRLIRNLSASEWTVLFGDQTYIPLCENLPVP